MKSGGSGPLRTPSPGQVRVFLARRLLELTLVAVCVYLAYREPTFRTPENLLAVLRAVSLQGLIALGMTMVIIVGEIDLSVGSLVAFSGCLLAYLTRLGWPIHAAAAAAVSVGALFGVFTGVMRARFQVPTFITTLALYTGLHGGALMLTNGFPITPFPPAFSFLGSGSVFGIPFTAVVLGVAFLLAHAMLSFTSLGRAIYAVGGNPGAARLAGVNVAAIRTFTLALTGVLAALSGIMQAARLMSGTPTVAEGWELDVIAAVIVGGTSFTGGIGSVWGTLVGIIFIGVVMDGMTLMNIPAFAQYVVRGFLIFAAVLINRAQVPRER